MIHKNYDWKASVTELTRDLDLDMLSTRRKISRLCILQKAIGASWHFQSKTTRIRPRGKPEDPIAEHSSSTRPGLTSSNIHIFPEQ